MVQHVWDEIGCPLLHCKQIKRASLFDGNLSTINGVTAHLWSSRKISVTPKFFLTLDFVVSVPPQAMRASILHLAKRIADYKWTTRSSEEKMNVIFGEDPKALSDRKLDERRKKESKKTPKRPREKTTCPIRNHARYARPKSRRTRAESDKNKSTQRGKITKDRAI